METDKGETDRSLSKGSAPDCVRLFLAGDVMLGRGIDQVLPHPGDPEIFEQYMRSAKGYVRLAEQRNGAIVRPVPFGYVWGDLSADLAARKCDLRIINLETAITTSDDAEPKGINYRMNPANLPVLSAAEIDAVSLANNHSMDWGVAGLVETLESLTRAGIGVAGAGRTLDDAARPLTLAAPNRPRVHLLAYGATDSGIPEHWQAQTDRPGVNLLPRTAEEAVTDVQRRTASVRGPRDLLVVSVHWGGNWGYDVPQGQRRLARALIDHAGVDIVYGHSSHHPKPLEHYRGKLILYGCGDLINDYEGIAGHEAYRSELVLGYVVDASAETGDLLRLELLPYHLRSFRLGRATKEETAWLGAVMARECEGFGVEFRKTEAGTLELAT